MKWTFLKWITVAAALLAFCGCIELTGQRITMRYDQAADRIYLLFHYDGIHNSERGTQKEAERSLRRFVAEGEVMLLDWFGHFPTKRVRGELDDEDLTPRVREFGALALDSMEVRNLGRYRDLDGRIGAAQMVVFNQGRKLIAAGNAAINEAFLAMDDAEGDEMLERTFPRWRELAAQDYEWITLEGNSLVWHCEVDPTEWLRLKLQFIKEMADYVTPASDEAPADPQAALLAAAPLSIAQTARHVDARIGFVAQPWTFRLEWRRDDYESNVESVVEEILPEDLDATIAHHLLNGVPASGDFGEVLAWGPAEEQVRAVLRAERREFPLHIQRSPQQWLADFGARWNAGRGSPAAPEPAEDQADYMARWADWYRAVVSGPEPE